MNKTNNGKRLFAVVAVFAMLACCLAVAVPAVDAQDGAEAASEPNYTVSVSGGIESLQELTNDMIGNSLSVEKVGDDEYLITGIAMYIGDSKDKGSEGLTDVQTKFFNTGVQNGFPYGIIYKISGLGESDKYLGYISTAGDWRSGQKTSGTSEMLQYVNADNANGSSTYYISDKQIAAPAAVGEGATAALAAAENAVANGTATKLVVSWDLTLSAKTVGGLDVTIPIGMGMSVTGNTATLSGSAIAPEQKTVVADNVNFGTLFGEKAAGYSYLILNGITYAGQHYIVQTNSALSVYEGDENIENVDGQWVKTGSVKEANAVTDYAFLIPKTGGVTIQVYAENGENDTPVATYTFNFSGVETAQGVSENSKTAFQAALAENDNIVYTGKTLSGPIDLSDMKSEQTATFNNVALNNLVVTVGTSSITFNTFTAEKVVFYVGSFGMRATNMTGEIPADNTDVSGTLAEDVTIVASGSGATKGDAYIPANGTLNLQGYTLTIKAGVVLKANGAITNGTIIVEQGAVLEYSTLTDIDLQNNGTVKVIGGQGTENIISVSQSVNGTYYLTADTTILEGVTLTVPRNAVLDLQGYNLTIEGTLAVDRNGTVISTGVVDGKDNAIILKSTGAIQNNGTIGKDGLITVKNGETPSVAGDQTVSMQEINGVNIQLVRSLNTAGDRVYDMYVSGNVSKISGAVNPTLSIVNVGINADMSIGKDVTFNVDNAVVSKNVTLTNGGKVMTITNDLKLSNGSKVVINAPTTGTIVVPTGTIESGDEFVAETEGQSSVQFTAGTTGNVVGLTVSAGRVTIPNDDGTADIVQRMYIGGSMGVAEKETKAGITLSNNVYISESLFVPEEVVIAGTYNIIVDQAGTVTAEAQEDLTFTGAEYIIETTSEGVPTETYYYTSFANAMAQIAAAQGNVVYVSGTFEISGTYNVAADQYIEPKGTHAVTVAEDGAITVDSDGVIENDTFVKIYGKVTALEGTGYTPAKGAKIYAVYTVDEETNDTTYSGFKLALDGAAAGQTITVVDEAEYDGNMTIISGVTVDVDAGVTLTVLGNVTVDGKLVLDNLSTLKVGKDTGKDYTITVNGELDASEGGKIAPNNGNVDLYSTGTTTVYKAEDVTVDVNAAYYIDGETVYTSVAKAVAYAEENALPNVYAKGTFTENGAIESDGVNINILGTVTLGTVTINNAKIQIGTDADEDACYTADVSGLTGTGDATATVSVSKTKATVESIVKLDAAGQNGYALSINSIDCAVEIAAGTVQVTDTDIDLRKTVTLTIASGATMLVNEDTEMNLAGGEYLKNSGTVQIDGAVTIDGYTLIPGNVTVSEDGSLTATGAILAVTGNVAVDADGTFKVNGALQVGESPELLGVATTGSVDGEISLGADAYVIVFNGASVADATITDDASNELNTTAFTINGIAFATIYTTNDIGMDKTVLTNRITSMKDLAVVYDDNDTPNDATDDTPIITWYSGEQPVSSDAAIGEYATLNTDIRYNTVPVTISIGSHITLSIDNVIINSYNGFEYPLTIGTHTISAVVDPGYSGDVTIVFNGQPVTNGQIEITSEMLTQLDAIILSATGSLTQDSTVVVDGGSSGDSGMGLTDYLLIILVILIVVMAIMVAMRLMRS